MARVDGDKELLEPLAIIGFSLRFPQDANTPDGLWKVLLEKKCLMTDFPKDRFNPDAFFHRDTNQDQPSFVSGAHFVKEDLGVFDASFFGISTTEALAMDPQHRILLETTYHALETAGISIQEASGTKTGVYSGSMTDDYKHIVMKDPHDVPKYAATGLPVNMIANRISWFYDFLGPSINMDSACSSSLMAFDVACQGLRNRDADMAIVAGSSITLAVEGTLSLMNMSFLSPQGRCFSFDHRADGYSRGEGFSVVILKRLEDAIDNGDLIRAVVRSSGSNQDGHTPGITQPSTKSQAALIRETYGKAGLKLDQTRFFEAHGTGTAIGDPIEADGIGTTFRTVRSPQDPLYVGALKSNIGHLEGGSGLAGIIKTVMVLEKGIIPPNANFERPNPSIDIEFLNIEFPAKCILWPSEGLRRASVASFGFGGSNAHVILDDAFNYLESRALTGMHCTMSRASAFETLKESSSMCNGTYFENGNFAMTNGDYHSSQSSSKDSGNEEHVGTPYAAQDNSETKDRVNGLGGQEKLLVFSTADEEGIRRLAESYRAYYETIPTNQAHDHRFLERIAYTLSCRRSVLAWRSFAIVHSPGDLGDIKKLLTKPARVGGKPRIAFVFTGQGAHYRGMGAGLLTYQVFRDTIGLFDDALAEIDCTFSVQSILKQCEPSVDIDDPLFSQLTTTGLQIALIELLKSFKIRPVAVVGHSSGEIAAAYAAGALSISSACRISYYRGWGASVVKRDAHSAGAMMSVNVPERQIRDRIDRSESTHGRLTVACINSDRNVTVSGEEKSIDDLKSELDREGIFARKINTGVAYHSPFIKAVAPEYISNLSSLQKGLSGKETPLFISSVTGASVLSLEDLCNAKYWVDNMISPVEFSKAMKTLISPTRNPKRRKLGSISHGIITHIVEIGPHSSLQRPILENVDGIVPQTSVRYFSALNRNEEPTTAILKLIGQLFTTGCAVDLEAVNQISLLRAQGMLPLTNLPQYPFNHSKSYWFESPLSKNTRRRNYPRHELLGAPTPDWNPLEARWRKFFDQTETPWIADHKVNGKAIYPATGMVAMAVEAATYMTEPGKNIEGYLLRDATFSAPIVVDRSRRTEVQLYMQRDRGSSSDRLASSYNYRVYTHESERWIENCRGFLQVQFEAATSSLDTSSQSRKAQHFRDRYDQMIRDCSLQVPTEKIYGQLEANGLNYGPSFQAMSGLAWDGHDAVVGNIQCFEWTPQHSKNSRQHHVAHPVTLDAVGQLMWVALTKGAQEVVVHGPAVTRIQSAWLAGSGLSYPDSKQLRACCTSQLKGLRGTDSSMFAQDVDGNLKLIISHMETTAVGGDEYSDVDHTSRQICFELRQTPHLEFMNADELVAFTKLGMPVSPAPSSFYQDLNTVLCYFARSTLERHENRRVSTARPYLNKYLDWIDRQISKLRASRPPSNTNVLQARLGEAVAMESLMLRLENTNAEGRLFVNVGRNLDRIIDGSVDPLEITVHSGLADSHYHEVCEKILCCAQIRKYMDALSHEKPGLKIIEIGAGFGSITRHIIDPLSNIPGDVGLSRYDYTDISKAFFEQASRRFAAQQSKMKFKVLNIEIDPVEQGFEAESYDVVVAAWVLHATRVLANTIRNTRKLLKPGGKLILLEITEPDLLRNGFVFGTLPGWWLSQEKEREWSPCLSESGWSRMLEDNGFRSIDCVLPDYEARDCHENSIILATAAEPVVDTHFNRSVIIVIEAGSQLQNAVAGDVQYRLEREGNVECRVTNIRDLASTAPSRTTTVLFMMELERPYLAGLDETSFVSLRNILCKLHTIIWVYCSERTSTSFADVNMITGLARVLCTEHSTLKFATVALENHSSNIGEWTKRICQVYGTTLTDSSETEYVEQDGTIMTNRVFQSDKLNKKVYRRSHFNASVTPWGTGPPLALTVSKPGLLESMRFEEDETVNLDLSPNEFEIRVQSVGVNFRDLLVVLGRYSANTVGCECSGVVTRVGANCKTLVPGDRVCAPIMDCVRTYARCDCRAAIKIPDEMSMAVAASLLITGVTAYHSLVTLARLQKGESILIHSAAGGTGQMAVQLAMSIGADVFVTVGSEEKKRLIADTYGISDSHIFYSRNTSFAQDIMLATNERGVDVVLNSLAGDALVASWEAIAPFGRFVEMGKADIESNSKLPMSYFAKNVSFHAVAMDYTLVHRPAAVGNALQIIVDMVTSGNIKPAYPLQEYPISELEAAFRNMQTGKNVGKTILNLSDSDRVSTYLAYKPSYSLDPSATYLIAGGFGGLGRSAARWMSQRGAKNLILLSRSGPKSQAAKDLLKELAARGARAAAPKCDISSSESLSRALRECSEMPQIRGCIQGTMVLQDALFETMTWDQWSASLNSKITGTFNLHMELPSDLSFFIILSSVAGIAGSLGQSNYATGNTYQDAFAAHRRAMGQSAVSIDLGWMGDVGIVAESATLIKGKEAAGDLAKIYEKEFLALLDYYCNPNLNINTTEAAQPILGLVTPRQLRDKGHEPPDWLVDRPLFRGLKNLGAADNADDSIAKGQVDKSQDIAGEFKRAKSSEEEAMIATKGFVHKLGTALSLSPDEIDPSRPVHVYGVDSLLAVELRNWFAKTLKADITVFNITGQASLEKLAEQAARSSNLKARPNKVQ